MLAFARQVLAVLVAFAIVAMFPVFLAIVVLMLPHTPVLPGTWLEIELNEPLLEHYAPPALGDLLYETPPCLMEVVENLEKAAVDRRIEGVLFRLDGFAAGEGKIDEIRAGVRAVKAAGKPVHAFAHEYTDDSVLLASECDRAFLFPKGTVYFLGKGAQIEHIKGTLEKLGIRDNIHRIEDYKSAAEFFTSKESSAQTIENARWLLEDLVAATDSALAGNLGVPVDSLPRLRERGLFRGEDAVVAGLVDETIDVQELQDRLGEGGEFAPISSADYAGITRGDVGLEGGARIAVVHAQGFVGADGEDRFDPVVGLTLGADRVVEDLEEVAEDDDYRAVILRWDTGGGATAGAERIAAAVARVRARKPVVVSVADQAASGGYMMSQDAHRIICAANGITGSIGSVTGKLNLRGLYEKLGMTIDGFALAPNAFFFSPVEDFTPSQWQTLTDDHWAMYREWIAGIAAARGLTPQEVDAAARGRVWTGRQALGKGLVDALGGFDEAVAAVKDLADLAADEHVAFTHYPPKRTLWQVLLEGDFQRVANATFHASWRSALRDGASLAAGGLSWSPLRIATTTDPAP